MKKIVLNLAVVGIGLAVSAADPQLATYPYGICAHVTRDSPRSGERGEYRLNRTLDAMAFARIKYVRADFDASSVIRSDGTWDFSNYDDLINTLESRGVTLLPIIYGRRRNQTDANEYRDYVATIVRHYGRRFPVVEIWNEANLEGFFPGADPVHYAKLLAAAYEGVKSVDPAIRVAFTGTAGVPIDWIRKVFEAGGAKSFDIMNVHPYSHPAQPEGSMDVKTEELRALMAEFGVADKPIWFTEIGWPTHQLSVPFPSIILAGLKVARPEQKSWRVMIIDNATETKNLDQGLAQLLLEILPDGSTAKVVNQQEAVAMLTTGEYDAVMYPTDESFPADTIKVVNDFITQGGVFIDIGGLPCYFGRRDGESDPRMQHGGALPQFPFGYRAWWQGHGKNYPRYDTPVFATEAGKRAGVKQEPTGFKARRFLAPDRCGKEGVDYEWVPLVAGTWTNGVELVSAAVIRYRGARTGASVLCALYAGHGVGGTNTEENQACFTARGLGIAFAECVEAYFPYNLRAFELDPFYSEDHFGIVHNDFQPKPAYSAYSNFIRERPAGSVNRPGSWHDKDRRTFCPQWTRPDGAKGGMAWRIGNPQFYRLRFTGGEPTFHNLYGRKFRALKIAPGEYRIELSPSPIYFVGAELVGIKAL